MEGDKKERSERKQTIEYMVHKSFNSTHAMVFENLEDAVRYCREFTEAQSGTWTASPGNEIGGDFKYGCTHVPTHHPLLPFEPGYEQSLHEKCEECGRIIKMHYEYSQNAVMEWTCRVSRNHEDAFILRVSICKVPHWSRPSCPSSPPCPSKSSRDAPGLADLPAESMKATTFH